MWVRPWGRCLLTRPRWRWWRTRWRSWTRGRACLLRPSAPSSRRSTRRWTRRGWRRWCAKLSLKGSTLELLWDLRTRPRPPALRVASGWGDVHSGVHNMGMSWFLITWSLPPQLAVRKPKAAKNKEAKENTNPNTSKAKEPKAKAGAWAGSSVLDLLDSSTLYWQTWHWCWPFCFLGDVKTKKTKSAAVEVSELFINGQYWSDLQALCAVVKGNYQVYSFD